MIEMKVTDESFKSVLKKLDELKNKFPEKVVDMIHTEGLIIESEAKKNLTSGILKHPTGLLSSSIHSTPFKDGVMVSASKNYAAYVEFGTGNMVSIPPGWEAFAARFKGNGLREVNLKPRPYLVKAFIEEMPKFKEKLNKLLKSYIKR